MGKGTPARGKHSKGKVHITCRRCGNHSFHATKKVCSSCGYGKSSKLRKYSWAKRK